MPAYFVAVRSRIKDPAELKLYAEKSPASAAGRSIKRLATATGKGADTFAGLIAGLNQRHDDFATAGCRASDHGLDYLPDAACTEAEAKAIWEAAIAGKAATLEEAEKFTAFIMLHVGRLNHAKGWATQLHLGAVRDPNLGLLKRLGSDAGCDTKIGRAHV